MNQLLLHELFKQALTLTRPFSTPPREETEPGLVVCALGITPDLLVLHHMENKEQIGSLWPTPSPVEHLIMTAFRSGPPATVLG